MEKKKILITGVNGLLGKDIYSVFNAISDYDIYGIGRKSATVTTLGNNYIQLDLTELEKVEQLIKNLNPDIIVHCAAYTKLDDCEKNKEYAYKMNVKVTEILAKNVSYMIYISSDAVFSGNKENGYTEEDSSEALNYYGQTKYEGEVAARKCEKFLIIRSSMYGYKLDESSSIAEWGIRNFLKGKEITGFSDVIFNPLYSKQLSRLLLKMMQDELVGTYHLGASQSVSKYVFFQMISHNLGKDIELVKEGSVKNINFVAKRTLNTSLSINKIKGIYDLDEEIDLQRGINEMIRDMKQEGKI